MDSILAGCVEGPDSIPVVGKTSAILIIFSPSRHKVVD